MPIGGAGRSRGVQQIHNGVTTLKKNKEQMKALKATQFKICRLYRNQDNRLHKVTTKHHQVKTKDQRVVGDAKQRNKLRDIQLKDHKSGKLKLNKKKLASVKKSYKADNKLIRSKESSLKRSHSSYIKTHVVITKKMNSLARQIKVNDSAQKNLKGRITNHSQITKLQVSEAKLMKVYKSCDSVLFKLTNINLGIKQIDQKQIEDAKLRNKGRKAELRADKKGVKKLHSYRKQSLRAQWLQDKKMILSKEKNIKEARAKHLTTHEVISKRMSVVKAMIAENRFDQKSLAAGRVTRIVKPIRNSKKTKLQKWLQISDAKISKMFTQFKTHKNQLSQRKTTISSRKTQIKKRITAATLRNRVRVKTLEAVEKGRKSLSKSRVKSLQNGWERDSKLIQSKRRALALAEQTYLKTRKVTKDKMRALKADIKKTFVIRRNLQNRVTNLK